MKMRLLVVFLILATPFIFSIGLTEAETGTLKYSIVYQDPATGAVTSLTNAFVYLHDASKPPPMEKFLSKADYINRNYIGNGSYADPNVPVGTWYIRITQRKDVNKPTYWTGPPLAGDYTWVQTAPIKIVAGQTLDLGTLYAYTFGNSTTIAGTVTNVSGVPLSGYYVRAQTEPCFTDGSPGGYINQCGPAKFLSMPTDTSGQYSLNLRDPGTYYIYTSTCFPYSPGCSGYCAPACMGTGNPAPVTVQKGESKTLNIVR